jgi:hypothetical protein
MTPAMAISVTITEAEGRKEPTQHGFLPCLAEGEGWRRGDDLYCDGRAVPYRLSWQWAASAASFWQSQLLLLLVH